MIKMPWAESTAPNLMIEVTDACNIDCRVCYKAKGNRIRSLADIENDLDIGMKLRPLHTVNISGGEPTMHPDLCGIVAMIHARGLHVFLLTNGLLVDRNLLIRLRGAGLDSILFHVDPGQMRSDLPAGAGFAEVRDRLRELAGMAHAIGLDVSISVTLYGDDGELLEQISRFFFATSELSFLFLARGVDLAAFHAKGDRGCECSDGTARPGDARNLPTIVKFFENSYGIEPFSCIPTNNGTDSVWVSYFTPIVYRPESWTTFRIRSNRADTWLMEIPRMVTGKYIHKTTQKGSITLLRTLLNGFTTFRWREVASFLLPALSSEARLRFKMIVYDDGPYYQDGALITCEYCPTAIVRNGTLVSCCTADHLPGGQRGNQ